MKLLSELIEKLKYKKKILLTTHRDCDGDGLGAESALFYALKKLNKDVKICHVDLLPKRYESLFDKDTFQVFSENNFHDDFEIALVFDTNDERLVEPLYSFLKKKNTEIIFVDHHPLLESGPRPTNFYIDKSAASTGEMVYNLIKELQISIDQRIAESIYTSIVFDTQIFRYIRNSINTHKIVIEILPLVPSSEEIHRKLFSRQTPKKISFLAQSLNQIDYFYNFKLAIVLIPHSKIEEYHLVPEDTRDLVDTLIDIDGVELAVVFREISTDLFKISFRSKKSFNVMRLSEKFGGGGHYHASGAQVKGNYEVLKKMIVEFAGNEFA